MDLIYETPPLTGLALQMAVTDTNIEEESFWLESSGQVNLHVHHWRGLYSPDKVVVIVHGMGGHGGYYASSLAPYLVPARTALYAPDLRGHGRSEGPRGDIANFELFQEDVAVTLRWARRRHPGLPLFLMGESMGTPLAITCAATAPADARPDFLAIIACVVAPQLMPRPHEVARTMYYLARDRQRTAIPITGREEIGVRDIEFIKVLKSDSLFNRKVSVRFLTSMTLHMQRAARMHDRLTLPVFMAQGGRDCTVSHRRTRTFFTRIAAVDKELHYFSDAFHAILNDPDSPQVRQQLMNWMERQRVKHASGPH